MSLTVPIYKHIEDLEKQVIRRTRECDELKNTLREIRQFVDQTYGDLIGSNAESLAARYSDKIIPMIAEALRKSK
jgi:hypothetical protein